jgi:uncharacterized LabA/DUF88 family protein
MVTTSTAMPAATSAATRIPRVRVFVDYWNLQLTLNERVAEETSQQEVRFPIDWRSLPAWLARKAADVTNTPNYQFEGGIIYASYNPHTAEGRKFHGWATSWLNRQPGVQVVSYARHPKSAPTCQACHQAILRCPRPECGEVLAGTTEKGVDSAIVTDMIRLAWEDAYEIAVLASSDADLVPAVNFLNQKGRRIVQAGFPPSGVNLATACWASFDIFRQRHEIQRPEATPPRAPRS